MTGSITGISRKLMASVAGYDLMFVPVKSVAALHALAPLPIAKTIEDCHHRAVNDALDMLQTCRRAPESVLTARPRSTLRGSFTRRSPTAIPAPVILVCAPMWWCRTRFAPVASMVCGAGIPWTGARCTRRR